MSLTTSIYPYKADYPEQLGSYLAQIKEAISLNKHHDHRRALFINYLRIGYGVDPVEIEIEQKVKVANVRGNIDALYKYLIFEFKADIEAERATAFNELIKYFSSRINPDEYLAVLTDGIFFEVYQYEKEKLKKISSFTLDEDDIISSYKALDDLIFVSKKITPSAADITTRFGPHSAIFNKSKLILENLFNRVKDASAVGVKLNEWNSLLARVYGEKIGDELLFLKHTYLTMFSRLLVTNALFPSKKKTKNLYKDVLNCSFFIRCNLPNLAEQDFFCWALDTETEEHFIGLLAKIDKYLNNYRLDNIAEDILKEIYQELVDPESRHSLGEYYTPDWIADIALNSLKYRSGNILDPACGSGTFLMAVIRRLRKIGVKGAKLVDNGINSIIGIDVHPLAVIMSKTNLVLALANEVKAVRREIYLPVYMSDTLMTTEEKKTNSIKISVSEDEDFRIPTKTTSRKINIDELIDNLAIACKKAIRDEAAKTSALKGFLKKYMDVFSDDEIFFWKQNFYLFHKLMLENKDTIWAFILKNAFRPAYIRKNKVDFIIGNPPWLAYRYIKDKGYKKKIKELVLAFKLLGSEEVKLFTQMDTSTLFYVYCMSQFLKDKGKIAFVMPKTTILPAKQHRNFQLIGFSEIHDFSNVSPLFNVRSVLLMRDPKKVKKSKIPGIVYKGILPQKNMDFEKASPHLKLTKKHITFLKTQPQNSHYYPLFQQGATIVPRCFWFIKEDRSAAKHATAPYIETNDETMSEAKDPWRIKIRGRIEKQFFFETVLAKGLIPFGITRSEPVFLPLIKQKKSISLADSNVLMENGFMHSSGWLGEAEVTWEKLRTSEGRSLVQWLNYNQKLTKQNIDAPYVVLYNTSGTNIAAAMYIKNRVYQNIFKTNGFIADAKNYYYYPKSIREGYYLVAILNSYIVNKAIKAYQPQGLFGERDIHRRPFEICMVPKYDSKNKIHQALAKLGEKCHFDIEKLTAKFKGPVGRMRTETRKILKRELIKINKLVRDLLIEAGQNASLIENSNNYENSDLFK